MDFSAQAPRAAEIHWRYLLTGGTCIDCNKGLAHQLPDMAGVDPGWKMPPELEGEQTP
jgi:cytochrome c-type protein NapC